MEKRWLTGVVCLLAVLALASAAAADLSPARAMVIPEAIWAAATGGGTWMTALQVTVKTAGTQVFAQFFYGAAGEYRSVTIETSTAAHQTFRFSNILQTMQNLDSGFTYYGRVGALAVYTLDDSYPIWVQAMTTNGNYGKTMPGFNYDSTENSANVGRHMVIPGLMNSTIYRTFVGAWNSNGAPMTVRFYVMSPNGYFQYSNTVKTIQPWSFVSFNPFADAGLTGTITNTWLLIQVEASTGTGHGLFCFGSIANNVTNDTYALIAIPYE